MVAASSAGIGVVAVPSADFGVGAAEMWMREKRCLSLSDTICFTSSKVTFRDRKFLLLSWRGKHGGGRMLLYSKF